MPQINLLKQSSPDGSSWRLVLKLASRVLIILLIGLVAYYGWLLVSSKNISNKIITAKNQIDSDRQTALSAPRRDELLTRQQQLKNLNDLISSHVYWSQIMPKLAAATLKTATYSSLKVGNGGNVVLSVNVPSLEELDKYLQVFDQPEVNKYFSDVRIGSYHKVQGKTTNSISFDVNMKFNPAIIQYAGLK